MESTGLKQGDNELGDRSVPGSNSLEPSKDAATAETVKEITPTAATTPNPPKLALIPLRSAAVSKIIKAQAKPLEAKQFPIVLGRTNLSQWWYESCDCQLYYCRLHCRPVAKNIGSLSKVMIQIDTQGHAHIVGKNPHLVTITSKDAAANTIGEKKEDNNAEAAVEHPNPIVLRQGDILSIGRREREPWMRFHVVDAANHPSSPNAKKKKSDDALKKNLQTKAREMLRGNEATSQTQQHQAATTPTNQRQKAQQPSPSLPEWITTTTTTNSNSAKRSKQYHNNTTSIYRTTTDTKEQQHHQAMVATLTKAAAAAGAAADADELRNKSSKKHYRYNSYYNYYNNNNTSEAAVADTRRKRRHTTSSFAHYHHQSSNSNHNKSLIRSAEDLFYNGSSRRGSRLHNNHDPQIHLVFQDYETSAQLIQAGTLRGRSQTRKANSNHHNINSNNNTADESRPVKRRKTARTDRNFIGKPNEEGTNPPLAAASNNMGLLSKNYAKALLEVNTPAPVDEKAVGKKHQVVLPTADDQGPR